MHMASQSHGIFADDKGFIADSALNAHQAVVLSAAGHVTAVTAQDTGIGVAAHSCASGDAVTVVLFGPTQQVLADGSSAIAAGDPLHINASGNFIKQTTGLAYQAIALEACASGTAYIEAVLLSGLAQTSSAQLAMIV